MKEQIPNDLILLIHNNFMVSLDVLREKQDCSLLSPQIGLQPRDLMMLILLIEEKFNIKIKENEIVNNRLDFLVNLVDVLEQQL